MADYTGDMKKYKVTDPQGNTYTLDPVDSQARQEIDDAKNIQFDEDYFTAEEDDVNKELNIGLNGVPLGVDETLQFVQDDAEGIVLGINSTVESGRITEIGGTPVGADVSGKADKSELPTNKAAAQGGTDDSLVTTGDKYTWNDWEDDEFDIPNMQTVINGVTYDYVRIGNQLWMTENLNDTFGLDLVEPGAYDTYGKAMIYNYQGTQHRDYGLLYNSLALDHITSKLTDGWKIPSLEDFNTLFSYCGTDEQAINQLSSTTGWNSTNGIDSYGFNAKPGGYRDGNDRSYLPGSCKNYGSEAMWWCSYNTYDKTYSISMTNSSIERVQHSFVWYLSVRLVKNLTA